MCLNPKWVYKQGRYKESNYRGEKGQFYELGTWSKCGSCETCVAERANNWLVRNYYEERAHQKKCFITLTYAENPYILVKKDMQDFLKRLRTNLDRSTGEKIRVFTNGEYGTINNRPHHHIIIYGWEDDQAKLIDINKKGNTVYQSKLIHETWGLGRTSYQNWHENEVPYIALYNTAQESFKRSYKLSREKIRVLERIAKNNIRMPEQQRKNLYKELSEYYEILEKEKKQYLQVKEYNTWSQSLGWEEFQKEYYRNNQYDFTEYINGTQFVVSTPSSWIKKLANEGDIQAAQEMFRRESEIIMSRTEAEERGKSIIKIMERRKKEIMDWRDQKTETEGIF